MRRTSSTFRGIANPIGVKVGPSLHARTNLLALREILNPSNEPGRLTLIHRFGAEQIERLPAAAGRGRTTRTAASCSGAATRCTATRSSPPSNVKTRRFRRHPATNSTWPSSSTASAARILGGAHFELTGENVTECTRRRPRPERSRPGPRLPDSDVDPRLNYEQAMEMALLIARRMNAAFRTEELAPFSPQETALHQCRTEHTWR